MKSMKTNSMTTQSLFWVLVGFLGEVATMGGRGPRAVAMAAFAVAVVHHAMGAKVDVTFEITGSRDVSKVCACVVWCMCV
jgi:hypothetical protein